ncbi:hypothetical protein ACFOOK_14495 [Micromonospora krabiensis]|uniref:Uncharacterized protein n=1 Tax=Micromonospora krabiensis TaxID=307121 RepID=A0A1C3N1B1_9ACTN|nr:hypothetical protein [Micromonospora krabiensis]SBV26355.1 hypothetical protein GA0070620_1843 [Micromonospora krabiensis]
MSETGHVDGGTDRPDGVTDPLLWKLALGVADAHEPDGEGGCRNLLCAGDSWPCTPWNNAQLALRQAQATERVGTTGAEASSGWSAPVVPAARRATPTATRDAGATASAA